MNESEPEKEPTGDGKRETGDGAEAAAPEKAAPAEKSQAPPPPPSPPPPKNPVEDDIAARFGGDVQTHYNFTDLEIRVSKERVVELCAFLKQHPETPYNYLRNLTAVDYKDRFEMVYHLCATATMHNVIVKADVGRDNPSVDSVVSLWSGADWQEREVYDLFGIRFNGHPDLRRIMLPDEWAGHPLRKDYVIEEKQVENWREAPGQKN